MVPPAHLLGALAALLLLHPAPPTFAQGRFGAGRRLFPPQSLTLRPCHAVSLLPSLPDQEMKRESCNFSASAVQLSDLMAAAA